MSAVSRGRKDSGSGNSKASMRPMRCLIIAGMSWETGFEQWYKNTAVSDGRLQNGATIAVFETLPIVLLIPE
ncbi:hypothetical protein GOC56_21155 [Sinorhizobium meliloti]|nr:hypothetical protein [Sinorhizobium meliloti]